MHTSPLTGSMRPFHSEPTLKSWIVKASDELATLAQELTLTEGDEVEAWLEAPEPPAKHLLSSLGLWFLLQVNMFLPRRGSFLEYHISTCRNNKVFQALSSGLTPPS